MGFQVTGVTTVSDVRDGVSPPTIYLTNENHTFVADAAGVVTDFTDFFTDVQVFVGTTAYTYTSGTPTGTQFTIGSRTVTPATADLDVNVSGTGRITISDQASNDGFADGDVINQATISVPITVAGFASSFTRIISISKAIGGSAPIIRVASNTQTVSYDQDGNLARTADIVISASELNFTGAGTVTFTYRSGSSGSFVALAGVTGVTIDTTASPETATITATAYNTLLSTNRSVTFRATRGGTFDQITVARVDDGAAAVNVIINTISGSNILRSDSDVVVIRADTYRSGTLLTPESNWTYQWAKDGTNLTSGNQETLTGITQETGEGFNQRSLRIQGDGINDGESSLFSCVVTEPN